MNDEEIDLDAPVAPAKGRKRAADAEQNEEEINLDGPSGSSEPTADDAAPPQMTERERKLFELRMKLNQARKMNYKEVVDEDKRSHMTKKAVEASYRFEKRKEAAEEEGVDPDKYYLHETAEQAMARESKKGKNKGVSDQFTPEALYRSYKKRSLKTEVDTEMYANDKQLNKDKELGVNDLSYGDHTDLSRKQVDRMVDELRRHVEKREKFSRRRPFSEDQDVDYINERNYVFNKKIERYYGQYTAEIKANLERGTALPNH
eukprot:tig00020693_g13013.t1